MATTTLTARTLGDLVAERPTRARVLDRRGLDYCCHGDRTLAAACDAAGLDAASVAAELDTAPEAADDGWTELPAAELADHIVTTHHRYLRDELPLLEALVAKVLDAHGDRHPELTDVQRLVSYLRADLEPHLDKEELVLFPAIHALFAGRRDFPFGTVANPIAVMSAEHDRAAELLAALREATSGYRIPDDACASYRSLYERLATLEHDTHVHIHKENHRLFPAAVAEESRG